MNCNIYFFIGTQKGYSQYPDNYSKDIISNILAKTDRKKNLSQFTISMNGKLAYMTYQYRYSDSKYFGICCEYNNVAPTNFEYLFEFFDDIVQDILAKGEIIHYDSAGIISPSIDYISDKIELVNYYSNYINNHLNDRLAKYINLPSKNYTSEKKKVVVLAYDDKHTQLIDLLNTYDNVVISRDNPYVLGYVNTLKKSSEKISQLEAELAKINRQKKQYRIVVILILAVAACLVALYSFNSNIQTLTGDLSQRNEEIKELNQDLLIANEKIDTMSVEIAELNYENGDLKKEVSQNNRSIDSLNKAIISQKTLINDLRTNLSSVNSKLSSTSNQLSTAKSNLDDAKRKLANYQNKVGKSFPLIINNIELANYTKDREKVLSDYGKPIYSKKSKWIWFRINYDGMVSGTKKLYYRIYDSDGDLKTCSTSPSGFSHSTQEYIYQGTNTSALFGWGSDSSGSWRKGKYRIEIWYEDICLKSKSFTIL